MARYDPHGHVFRTPKGVPVVMYVRDQTNDWNTAQSALNEDEYGLASLDLTGLAVDIGGHIGTVSVGLAIDNPKLRVLAVEPIPENLELLHANAAANGVQDRITAISAMGGAPGRGEIRYGFKNSETALHHAFIGNSKLAEPEGEHTVLNVPSYSLWELLHHFAHDEIPSFVKIDCEGGEYDFLRWSQDIIRFVPLILGERHPDAPDGKHHPRSELVALLPNHDVTFTGPEAGPEGFRAVRRG